jgi:hypothetical protein
MPSNESISSIASDRVLTRSTLRLVKRAVAPLLR